jgi:hypothetical protein
MGYWSAFSECAACGRVFTFNPRRVPALVIKGSREPICRSCAERWNMLHPEIARPILPGAYDPLSEDEMEEE